MVGQHQVLMISCGIGFLALGIGFILMPSDEAKAQYWNKKLNSRQNLSQQEIQKMKENEKTGKQFMDAIRKAADSQDNNFGSKDKK